MGFLVGGPMPAAFEYHTAAARDPIAHGGDGGGWRHTVLISCQQQCRGFDSFYCNRLRLRYSHTALRVAFVGLPPEALPYEGQYGGGWVLCLRGCWQVGAWCVAC